MIYGTFPAADVVRKVQSGEVEPPYAGGYVAGWLTPEGEVITCNTHGDHARDGYGPEFDIGNVRLLLYSTSGGNCGNFGIHYGWRQVTALQVTAVRTLALGLESAHLIRDRSDKAPNLAGHKTVESEVFRSVPALLADLAP